MADSLDTERDPLEVLAAEYMERLRRGERPSVDDYAAQHPQLAEEIRELFPTIAVTERLKASQQRTSGGRVSLGGARLERLGDFRIIREIGRGGMGVVFEAEQESLGRRVAVKVLPRQVLLDERHLKRFQREARIAANLHHTHIVEVFGVGQQDGFHYYVMQYIEGVGLDRLLPHLAKTAVPEGGPPKAQDPETSDAKSLAAAAQRLLGEEVAPTRRFGPTYWRNVARLGWQAAEALNYAHGQGVLHRDIKPANLLFGCQGTVWLTDFGLAKAVQSEELSLSRDVVGTLRYMPWEQLQGKADHRGDIYSLGLTLYELLTLRPAYDDADQSSLMRRIAQGPPPPPRSLRADVPRDLETIVLKATSHEPSARYASAGEMASDLRCFLEDRPIRARRVGPLERLGRWCRRNPAMAGLGATTLLLLVLVAAVSSVGYLREERERAKAEANAALALGALDRVFERLYPARVLVRTQPEGTPGVGIGQPRAPILTREAAALLEDMLPFYDRLAQQTGNGDELRLRIAEANRRVGAIRQRLGQTSEAVQAYRRALVLFQALGARRHAEFTLPVAQIRNELGCLFTAQRQFADGRALHLAALAPLQKTAAAPAALPAARFELARTYFFLGVRERPLPTAGPPGPSTAESEEQRLHLSQAVTLLHTLLAQQPGDPEYRRLLALCYLEGAPLGEGREPRAAEGDERAIELLEGLHKAYPDVADYAYDLSEAYTKMHIPRAPIPPELEKNIEVRLENALGLLEQLAAQHPDVPGFLVSQARVHHKLGSFFQRTDRWREAERGFREAIACQERLLKPSPDAPYYRYWMAVYRIAVADVLFQRNQPNAARAELEETIASLRAQPEQQPSTLSSHDLLASAYSLLERVLRRDGDAAQADEAARQAQHERNAVRAAR